MLPPAYRSPFWLRGAHAQTIVPATLVAVSSPPYRRERVSTPDGDFLDFDWIDVADPAAPLLVLFHGLEGSSASHYARAMMNEVAARGWRGVVAHFRGCSGEINRAPRFYHSGDSREIAWIIGEVRRRHATAALYAVGVSLGGNALLRWLGEDPEASARTLRAAASISAPVDLAAGGESLAHGFNRVYTASFLRTLKAKCLIKLTQYPGLFDRATMLAARNLYEFDNVVTAPLHGYRDTDDYWSRAASKSILGRIGVPSLVLNARNDPFMPARYLPDSSGASAAVRLDFPEQGGHVGFYGNSLGLGWLPQRVFRFFQHGD